MIDRDNDAELILLNGEFRTQDPACPVAQAVAVSAGRIVAVGDDDEVNQLSRSHTKVIDLDRRPGLHGMMDSHFHYFDWALGRRNLNLVDVKAFGELIARVAQAASARTQGTWILGHELGSITPGKQADLIVLDRNIYTVPPMDIINANVDITVFDGWIVYQRELL